MFQERLQNVIGKRVYEVVDATDDVIYYSLGVFGTPMEAMVPIMGGPCAEWGNAHAIEETCTVEVRERVFGFTGQGGVILKITWIEVSDEEGNADWIETEREEREIKT